MGSGNTKPFPLTTDFMGSHHFPPPPSHPRSRPTPQRQAPHHAHPILQSPVPNPRHPSQLMDTFPTPPPPNLLRVFTPPSRTPSPTLLPPPLYNSPRAGPQKPQPQPHLAQRRRSNSGGSAASPRSVASESHQSLAEISCVSSLISEPDEIDAIGEEEEDEDDVDEEEGGDVLGGLGEQEQHVESLRRFRTQQAIRNLLLEREVKILQAQLEELELMEKEEQVAVGLRGLKDAPSATPYDSAFSLAELNRLYNNVLRVSPVPPPLTTPPFLSPTQPTPQPTLQDRQSPSLLQFNPSGSFSAACGGVREAQVPVSPAHSASDKSCHTEPGIGRVREAKVRRLKQKQHKRRVLQQQQQQQQQQPRGVGRHVSASSSAGLSERDTILDRLHKGLPAAPPHRRTASFSSSSHAHANATEAKASGDEKEKEGGERGGGKWAFQQSSGLVGSYRLQARRKRHRGAHIVFLDDSTGSTGCRFPASLSSGVGGKKGTGAEAGGGGVTVTGQQDTARSVGSTASANTSIECDMVTDFLHKAGHLTLLDASSDFTAGVGPSPVEPNSSSKPNAQSPKRTGVTSQERESPFSSGSATSASPAVPTSRAPQSESGATPLVLVAHPPLGQDKDKGEQGGRAAKLAKNVTASVSASSTGSGIITEAAGGGGHSGSSGAGAASLSCMATRWAEVELLLCKPIACSADITRTMLQTDAGLAFMDQLDQRARELNVLRGTLARWLLPFDTNTAASEQRSVIESVLENEPDDLRGKLPQEEIQYLVRGANNVRRLIRVKIADDADLDQARRALRTAQTFFNALINDADVACLDPYELLCKNTQSLQQLTEDERCTSTRSHSGTVGADRRGGTGGQKSESTPSQTLKNSAPTTFHQLSTRRSPAPQTSVLMNIVAQIK